MSVRCDKCGDLTVARWRAGTGCLNMTRGCLGHYRRVPEKDEVEPLPPVWPVWAAFSQTVSELAEQSGRLFPVGYTVATTADPIQSIEDQLQSLFADVPKSEWDKLPPSDELLDPQKTIATLRERLRAQTLQTQETYKQVHDEVVEVLRNAKAIPEGIDPDGHPVEQVVGTCVHHLQGQIGDLNEQLSKQDKPLRRSDSALRAEIAELHAEIADAKKSAYSMVGVDYPKSLHRDSLAEVLDVVCDRCQVTLSKGETAARQLAELREATSEPDRKSADPKPGANDPLIGAGSSGGVGEAPFPLWTSKHTKDAGWVVTDECENVVGCFTSSHGRAVARYLASALEELIEGDYWQKRSIAFRESGGCPVCFAADEAGHTKDCPWGKDEARLAELREAAKVWVLMASSTVIGTYHGGGPTASECRDFLAAMEERPDA